MCPHQRLVAELVAESREAIVVDKLYQFYFEAKTQQEKPNETILKVFEKQFGVQPAFGAPKTVLVANNLILPTIAGGGDHQNIPRGFLCAAWIPIFLMSGWVFSLLFDAWPIWYGRM